MERHSNSDGLPDVYAVVQGLAVWLQSQDKHHAEVTLCSVMHGCCSLPKDHQACVGCMQWGSVQSLTAQSCNRVAVTRGTLPSSMWCIASVLLRVVEQCALHTAECLLTLLIALHPRQRYVHMPRRLARLYYLSQCTIAWK